ncbi:MAG: SGNH/GDSL hydrolase family protein [Marinoscillum sp.]
MRLIYLLCLIFPLSCMEADDARPENKGNTEDQTPVGDSSEPENEESSENEENNEDTTMINGSISFLALGDSYTIGESVETAKRWPVQLVTRLREGGVDMNGPEIIARTGWTTAELQNDINNSEIKAPYDWVSLLIGVNNQYRGYSISIYRTEFESLLQQAIAFAGGDKSRVIVVSIPDYGVTPFAANSDRAKIAREIDDYNNMARGFSDAYGVRFFNITPISREAATKPEYVAEDGLHPSGEMYAAWVEMILPYALEILDE